MYSGKSVNLATGEISDAYLTQEEIDEIIANAPPEPVPQPAPIAFYEEMLGANGATDLTGVFDAVITLSESNGDTSTLVSINIQVVAALVTNDWSKPYAPYALAAAYNKLKVYLSDAQKVTVEDAIARYHLGLPE
jgi:hypothetical protein